MSDVYVQEPQTHGRVLLKTNKGDLVVELWSRECPKACRNFVQLCQEGYYNGCIFHRIIPDFIVQTGDPSGSGTTCESIYGEPFSDEIHSRLRYRYRGMVGAASAGKDTNGSQFFLTLSKQDILNGKNTLFGKLVGDSIYCLTNIASAEVDTNDRPTGDFLPIILETVVLENPFPDIVARTRKPAFSCPQKSSMSLPPVRKAAIAGKRSKVLSFEDEDDDEEPVGGIVSAHDVLGSDKTLSSRTATFDPVPSQSLLQVDAPATPAWVPHVQQVPTPAIQQEEKPGRTDIEAEIERVQAAIKTASSSKDVNSLKHIDGTNRPGQQDEQIVKKLKLWSQSVAKSSSRQEAKNLGPGWLTSTNSRKDPHIEKDI